MELALPNYLQITRIYSNFGEKNDKTLPFIFSKGVALYIFWKYILRQFLKYSKNGRKIIRDCQNVAIT